MTDSSIVCANKVLDLTQPQVMGILNVTPDSFSDGGHFHSRDKALLQAQRMIAQGAAIIDIGGESTRPGAMEVSVDEELDRVIPLVEKINAEHDIIISVDTSKAEVMLEAVKAGAGLINDVRALQNTDTLKVLSHSNVAICLMHMQGLPRTMQDNPHYDDVIEDIADFFKQRIDACIEAGIARQRLILDPGFGFGKTLQQNYQILAHLKSFQRLGLPLLAGMSRKSMIGNLLNNSAQQRLAGSLSAAVLAVLNGAQIVRVHDVKETVDALKVLTATQQEL
jgi:dihydropteroate synthase